MYLVINALVLSKIEKKAEIIFKRPVLKHFYSIKTW
jgi:hypothetical protein